jgi:hypothetical protein
MSSLCDENQALHLAQNMYNARLPIFGPRFDCFCMPNFTGEDRASERMPFYQWLTPFCRAMGTRARRRVVNFCHILLVGITLSKLPSIAGVEICLYTLYYEVIRAGGIEKVQPRDHDSLFCFPETHF